MPSRRHPRAFARLLGATLALALGLALTAAPAGARVEATGKADNPGTTKVTFVVDRGCTGAPGGTTALRVQLPAGTTEVKPQSPPGWNAQASGEQLDWTGGPATGPVTFETTMRIPGMVDDVVYLPTIQVCGPTEEAWTDQGPDRQAAHAAPRVSLQVTYLPSRPSATAPGSAPATAPATEPLPAPAPPAAPEDGASGAPLALVAGAAALVAIVLGGMMAARRLAGGG